MHPKLCTIVGQVSTIFESTVVRIIAASGAGVSEPALLELNYRPGSPSVRFNNESAANPVSALVGVPLLVSPLELSDYGSPVLGCRLTFDSPSLPVWARLDPLTCAISGTPDGTLISTVFSSRFKTEWDLLKLLGLLMCLP